MFVADDVMPALRLQRAKQKAQFALCMQVADGTLLSDLGEGNPTIGRLTQAFLKIHPDDDPTARHVASTPAFVRDDDARGRSRSASRLGCSRSLVPRDHIEVYAHVTDRLKATSASRLSEAFRQARARRAVTNR
ncbi:MAG: hypothetical protein NVSMB64_30320 [Candidatus Velthaea sp.]